MPIITVPQAIVRGDISIYLSAIDNKKGSLFTPRIAAPLSNVTIAMVTDALRWGYDGGAQTDESLRHVANYLIWLTGAYGQEAEAILNGGGGGSVVPSGPSNIYPFFIYSTNFESDGVTYIDTRIEGDTLSIFINEGVQQFFLAPEHFEYVVGGGFKVIAPWFDATQFDYIIRVEKIYPIP